MNRLAVLLIFAFGLIAAVYSDQIPHVSNNSKLTWDYSDDADEFRVTVEKLKRNEDDKSPVIVTGKTFDLNVLQIEEKKVFSVKVEAKNKDGSFSLPSDSIKWTNYFPNKVTGVKILMPILHWNPVPAATGYYVYVRKNGETYNLSDREFVPQSENPQYRLSQEKFPSGTYWIAITAVDRNKNESGAVDEKRFDSVQFGP